MTIQGELNGAGAWVATVKQEGEEQEKEEGNTGQAMVLYESRGDVSIHGFWE